MSATPMFETATGTANAVPSTGAQSHASPRPSRSESACCGFRSKGQLSHTSPTPSPSRSAPVGSATVGQLSMESGSPSPSRSAIGGGGGSVDPGVFHGLALDSDTSDEYTQKVPPLRNPGPSENSRKYVRAQSGLTRNPRGLSSPEPGRRCSRPMPSSERR